MNSMERVLCALSHKEPDRVPLFLFTNLLGAKETELPIRDYFKKPDNIVEGIRRLMRKYPCDSLCNFHYASLECEAWGGETLFFDDGPPNAGQPVIDKPERVLSLEPPRVGDSEGLQRVLEVTRRLKAISAGEIPIIGAVMSPFSLPVMQLGFEAYLDLLFGNPRLFERLMELNTEFCVEWANAQLDAGATAIGYFDPVSSPTIIPPEIFRKTGFLVAKRTLPRIHGPVVVHLASGKALPIVDELALTGAVGVGVSSMEDLGKLKQASRGKFSLLGNLNGIEMRHWTAKQAEAKVRDAIDAAGQGGGLILSDNHGEIPWQVPETVLTAIIGAVNDWGTYPLKDRNAQ